MKAVWNGQVVAETDKEKLIYIEGNWYFPPEAINKNFFVNNEDHTTCFWKGEASYYDVKVGDETNKSAAWYYPKPKEGSIERVKKDFTHYVAFWHGVEVQD